jgi:hypothetical protein
MRHALLLLLLAAVLPPLAAWHQYRQDAHERLLRERASELAGRPVSMRCQGLPSNLIDVSSLAGEVIFDHTGAPPDEATLKRDVCADLRRYPEERERLLGCVHRVQPCPAKPGRIAYAVHVFTHEAWHLHGVGDEAMAECYALQTTAPVARRLGATVEQAQALARWNLEHAYPYLPSQYHSSECRDGGSLDLRPASAQWP